MTEYEIGDEVVFIDNDDGERYVGEILAHYEHNGLYEIDIEEALNPVDEVPETGGADKKGIQRKVV